MVTNTYPRPIRPLLRLSPTQFADRRRGIRYPLEAADTALIDNAFYDSMSSFYLQSRRGSGLSNRHRAYGHSRQQHRRQQPESISFFHTRIYNFQGSFLPRPIYLAEAAPNPPIYLAGAAPNPRYLAETAPNPIYLAEAAPNPRPIYLVAKLISDRFLYAILKCPPSRSTRYVFSFSLPFECPL